MERVEISETWVSRMVTPRFGSVLSREVHQLFSASSAVAFVSASHAQ
jgi:hypothetical protein